jgi:AcrR family transcriptional regulator
VTATTRKPSAARREEIAWAALAIIGREGIGAFTMARLAEAVGVTSGALFRHFDSRQEILEEAVSRAEARIAATFPDPGLPPLVRLRALAEARIALLSEEPGCAWLLRSEQALLAVPAAARRRLEALAGRSRAFLAQAIEDGVAGGLVRADVPSDVLLLAFTATVHALIGLPGLQGRASAPRERALDGLLRLFSPPQERGTP